MNRQEQRPARRARARAASARRRGSGAGRGRRTARRRAAPAAASAGRSRAARACAAPSTACRSASRAAARESRPLRSTSSRRRSGCGPPKNPTREIERPAHGLRRPGRDGVRQVEERRRALARPSAAGRPHGRVPPSSGSTPPRHSNSVVLPEPFGPIRPSTSPAGSRTTRRAARSGGRTAWSDSSA